jgi:hypothetical protein
MRAQASDGSVRVAYVDLIVLEALPQVMHDHGFVDVFHLHEVVHVLLQRGGDHLLELGGVQLQPQRLLEHTGRDTIMDESLANKETTRTKIKTWKKKEAVVVVVESCLSFAGRRFARAIAAVASHLARKEALLWMRNPDQTILCDRPPRINASAVNDPYGPPPPLPPRAHETMARERDGA